VIPITEFAAEFKCGGKWQSCRVVGLAGEPNDLRFVVIIDGQIAYADTVSEVRRRAPSPEPFG
jgi:hypothetical protein